MADRLEGSAMQDSDEPDTPPHLIFDDKKKRRRLLLRRLSPDLNAVFSSRGEPIPPEFDDLLEQIDYRAARRRRDRS